MKKYLHKILHNVDHLLHCKILQFVKPLRITRHTAQQNDKAFVFWCFTYSTTRLWNSLSNAVLAIKQDRYLALAIKKFMIHNHH